MTNKRPLEITVLDKHGKINQDLTDLFNESDCKITFRMVNTCNSQIIITCVNCGYDAIGENGVCPACGWIHEGNQQP